MLCYIVFSNDLITPFVEEMDVCSIAHTVEATPCVFLTISHPLAVEIRLCFYNGPPASCLTVFSWPQLYVLG